MTALTDLLKKQNATSRTKITLAQAEAMIQAYQNNAPVGLLIQRTADRGGMGIDRFNAILTAAGVHIRTPEESIQIWRDNSKAASMVRVNLGGPPAGSEAQQNEGFFKTTKATSKPPRHRKAATTPRSKWVEVSDFCQTCGEPFAIHAPAHVAGKVHGMWVRWHERKHGVWMTGENAVVVAWTG